MSKTTSADKVLQYWNLLELLSQDNFPNKVSYNYNNSKYSKVTFEDSIIKYDSLFQSNLESIKPPEVVSDSIELYVGKISRSEINDFLFDFFGEEDTRIENDYSKIAKYGLKVDSEGYYKIGSFSVSPLLWGVHNLIKCKKSSSSNSCLDITNFDELNRKIDDSLCTRSNDGVIHPEKVTSTTLTKLDSKVNKLIFFEDLEINCDSLFNVGYMKYCDRNIKEEFDDSEGTIVFNRSFFSDDINNFRKNITGVKYSDLNKMDQHLVNYINNLIPKEKDVFEEVRVNVLEKSHKRDVEISKIMNINNAPMGKWPSRYSPAFAQQLAINAINMNYNSGIFSVNGPPGTGKTTLLKEVISNNIVEKAKVLSEYDSSDSLFQLKRYCDGPFRGSYDEYYKGYYVIKDKRVEDMGIVIASSNNNAVENITVDLPSSENLFSSLNSENMNENETKKMTAVITLFKSEDVYLKSYASKMFKFDTWGLISVPLGKKANINAFLSNVADNLSRQSNATLEKNKVYYEKSRKEFLRQYTKVEAMKSELARVADNYSTMLDLKADLVSFENEYVIRKMELEALIDVNKNREIQLNIQIKDIKNKLSKLYDMQKTNKIELEATTQKSKSIMDDIRILTEINESEEKLKSLCDKVLIFFNKSEKSNRLMTIDANLTEIRKQRLSKQNIDDRAAELGKEKTSIEEMIQNRRDEIEKILNEINILNEEVSNFRDNVRCISGKIDEIRIELETRKRNYQQSLSEYSNSENYLSRRDMISDIFWNDYDGTHELEKLNSYIQNPWVTFEYDREREKLFYDSLKMTEYFILSSKAVRANMKHLAHYYRGVKDRDNKIIKFSPRDCKESFHALFSTINLVVPVVSTTFASVGSMFKDFSPYDKFGLLIVDEAGQASPQMAIGSLSRASRALIVGDPKQVEPVVTSELAEIKKMIATGDLTEYRSSMISVQSFADALNPLGTYLKDNHKRDWIGSPLLVHRRCISPMYDISNSMCYNNFMLNQTENVSKSDSSRFIYTSTRWINVKGTKAQNKDHYVVQQGKLVCDLLSKSLIKNDNKLPDLFVITPFKTVSVGIKNELRKNLKRDEISENEFNCWLNNNVGTVHTFQGKEAKEVIFVLGCDKNSMGAVSWVNKNIINVAVTRAKYRLYVIGDYGVWCESNVVKEMKQVMDFYALEKIIDSNVQPNGMLLSALPPMSSFMYVNGDETEVVDSAVFEFSSLLSYKLSSENVECLNTYEFSTDETNLMSEEVLSMLRQAIFINRVLSETSMSAENENVDYSASSILFVKSLELHVKESMYPLLSHIITNREIKEIKLSKVEKTTLGSYCNCLRNEAITTELVNISKASKIVKLNQKWWYEITDDLKNAKDLRNKVCHAEKFIFKDYELLMNLLVNKKLISEVGFCKILV